MNVVRAGGLDASAPVASARRRGVRSEDPCGDGPEVADLVLHPVVLASLVLLVVNDHVAKPRWPGMLTGKASDVAGLVVAPVVGAALVVGGTRLLGWRPPLAGVVAVLSVVVAVGFALSKGTGVGELAYENGLGALQWVVAAAWSAVSGGAVPGLRPVELVADRSDLVALPAAVVPVVLARGGLRRAAPG